MPLERRFLADGEDVVVEVRPHWTVVAAPVLGGTVAVAAAVAVVVDFGPLPAWLASAIVVAAAFPALRAGLALARWSRHLTYLTSERLLFRTGVVRKTVVQVHLSRIEDVHCTQSLFDRMVGRGVLTLELRGGDPIVLVDVRRPRALQQVVTDELRYVRAQPSDAVPHRVLDEAAFATGEALDDDQLDPGVDQRRRSPRGARRARGAGRSTAPIDDGGAEAEPVPDAVPPRIGERLQELLDEFRNDELSAAEYEAARHEVLARWKLDRDGNG